MTTAYHLERPERWELHVPRVNLPDAAVVERVAAVARAKGWPAPFMRDLGYATVLVLATTTRYTTFRGAMLYVHVKLPCTAAELEEAVREVESKD